MLLPISQFAAGEGSIVCHNTCHDAEWAPWRRWGTRFTVSNGLPCEEQFFDAVINVEGRAVLPAVARFFAEVGHVLRAGGRFLCTDLRRREDTAEWDATPTDAAIGCVGRRSSMLRFCRAARYRRRSCPFKDSWSKRLRVEDYLPFSKAPRYSASNVSSWPTSCGQGVGDAACGQGVDNVFHNLPT
jgi:SAM-dependent methyltransferase